MKSFLLLFTLNVLLSVPPQTADRDDIYNAIQGKWASVTRGNKDIWFFVRKDEVSQDCSYLHSLGAMCQNWKGDYGQPWEYCVGEFVRKETGDRDNPIRYETIIERYYGRYLFKYLIQYFPGDLPIIRISNLDFPKFRKKEYLDSFVKISKHRGY